MALQFIKAERSKSKLRLGMCGPAGSGKTHTSLLIAGGMGGRIALIDTENQSAAKEVGKRDIPEFDTLALCAPYTPEKYIEAIRAAEAAGYDVIIIDSLTPAWAGAGGLLERADTITKSSVSKNSYMAWRDVTPVHNKLIDAILQSKCHVIATMRTKTEYVLVDDEKTGKKKPQKVGMAPIQREGMDYEFDLVLDIDQSTHYATASKDRTSLFDGQPFRGSPITGREIREWLESGVEVKPKCERCRKSGTLTDSVDDDRNDSGFRLCLPCTEAYVASKTDTTNNPPAKEDNK